MAKLLKCDRCGMLGEPKENAVPTWGGGWCEIRYAMGYGQAHYKTYNFCPSCREHLKIPAGDSHDAEKDIAARLIEILEEIIYETAASVSRM